jgi:hypothetical protein
MMLFKLIEALEVVLMWPLAVLLAPPVVTGEAKLIGLVTALSRP